jgi:iron complex outermembrane receptor protein
MFYRDPANEGSTSLTAEKMFALEGGVEFESGGLLSGLSLFRDDGKDIIDWIWDATGQKYRAMNISRIVTRGFELRTEYTPSNSSSFIRKAAICWSFIDPEKNTGNFESKYSLDNLKHKLQLSFDGRISKRIGTDWRIGYYSRNGSYPDYNETDRKIVFSSFKPYWLVDCRLSLNLDPVSLNLNVSNLLNTEYTDTGNLFQPGRWITAGIRLNLEFSNKQH